MKDTACIASMHLQADVMKNMSKLDTLHDIKKWSMSLQEMRYTGETNEWEMVRI